MAAACSDDAHAKAMAEADMRSKVTLQETLERVEVEVLRKMRLAVGDAEPPRPRSTIRGYLFKQSGGKQSGASANHISFGNLMSKWDRVGASPASAPLASPQRSQLASAAWRRDTSCCKRPRRRFFTTRTSRMPPTARQRPAHSSSRAAR